MSTGGEGAGREGLREVSTGGEREGLREVSAAERGKEGRDLGR